MEDNLSENLNKKIIKNNKKLRIKKTIKNEAKFDSEKLPACLHR